MNLSQIRKEITHLETRLELLRAGEAALTALGVEGGPGRPPKSKAAKRAPKAAAKPNGTTAAAGEKPTYIGSILPALEEIDTPDFAATLTADSLFKRLQRHYPDVKRNALDASIASELKKGDRARLVRQSKGNYSLSESYRHQLYNREQPAAEAKQQPEPTQTEQPVA